MGDGISPSYINLKLINDIHLSPSTSRMDFHSRNRTSSLPRPIASYLPTKSVLLRLGDSLKEIWRVGQWSAGGGEEVEIHLQNTGNHPLCLSRYSEVAGIYHKDISIIL